MLSSVTILATPAFAQVNSGSDGSDGALNPISNVVIDMHDHPTGVYQYSSVNIPPGVNVSFVPNDANTPTVWLVQGDCFIGGAVSVNAKPVLGVLGAPGGPGGHAGGNGPLNNCAVGPGPGQGPGGGKISSGTCFDWMGGNGSFGSVGLSSSNQYQPGEIYGSELIIPLIGGSGASGGEQPGPSYSSCGGGGGGGAVLIACSGTLTLGQNGYINATGSGGCFGGDGSGGAVRLITTTLAGGGFISTHGYNNGGLGRVRIEALTNGSSGIIDGVVSYGFSGIILIPSNQEPRLKIASIAGIAVPANPSGQPVNPDVIIPGLQSNPINIVVNCENVAVGSTITVDVKPANGATVTASAQNTGTTASSSAVVSVNMPRGGGTIQARTTTPVVLASATENRTRKGKKPSVYETGLAINGERFARAEITSEMGGRQQVVYITDSGKRFPLGAEIKKPTAPKRPAKKG